MCKIAEQFPEQIKDAITTSKTLTVPEKLEMQGKLSLKYGRPKNIIIAGMGGSAVGGNLLKDWLRSRLKIPIEVHRGYHLPAYADEKTLVLVVSYSGNTEETLSAYLEALEKRCMILAVTSGGLLREFSEKLGIPLAKLPEGYPPRSAIAYLFFPMVAALQKLEKMPFIEDEVKEAVAVVTKLREEIKPQTRTTLNPSKRLALGLKGSIPFVCGFDFYESVALRMKTQFNENSKTPAKVEFFPELNHNETVGWTGLPRLPRNFSVVLIRDDQEAIEIQTRIDITRRLVFDKCAKKVLEVRARGKSILARMFSTMYIGDFASIYLAVLYQINPAPVQIIDELKTQLIEKIDINKKVRDQFRTLITS